MRKSQVLVVMFAVAGVGCDDQLGDVQQGDGGEPQAAATSLFSEEGPTPGAQFLPPASGTCPGFVAGDGCEEDDTSLVCTFEPQGVPARPVRVWYDPSKTDGVESPVVFYYHGMGGRAGNTVVPMAGLGGDVVDTMLSDGAIVVALEMETGRAVTPTMQPWKTAVLDGAFEPDEGRFDDLLVQDEVIACLEEKLGVNSRRIHVTGLSAGALMTGNLIVRRSGYIASAAPFSGGIMGLPDEQDPDHKVPTMMSYGGPTDMAVGQDFHEYANDMTAYLNMNGNFHFICDHGGGHRLEPTLAPLAWDFFKAHPFGEEPAYAEGLPEAFPEYCIAP